MSDRAKCGNCRFPRPNCAGDDDCVRIPRSDAYEIAESLRESARLARESANAQSQVAKALENDHTRPNVQSVIFVCYVGLSLPLLILFVVILATR